MKSNWEELHTEYTDLFRQKTDLQIELLREWRTPSQRAHEQGQNTWLKQIVCLI